MHTGSKFKKWNRWLSLLHKDLKSILLKRHIFYEVQALIQSNPRIQADDVFNEWLKDNYRIAVVTGIRRQLDRQRDGVSLLKLLQEIQAYPEVLSRERYVSLYRRSTLSIEAIHRSFDEFAGEGGNHVSAAMVGQEITEMKRRAQPILPLADKRIVHYDESVNTIPYPAFAELDACLDYLEYLLKKYLRLFRAADYDAIVPSLPADWKQVFEYAWIETDG